MSSTTPYTNFLDVPVTEVRDFTLPTYSFEYSEDMEGLETRRVISDDGRHSEITLFYNHLNDAEVNLFIDFYNERVPAGRGFGLPQSAIGYPNDLFQEYLTTIGQVLYFFKGRPKIVTNAVAGTYSMFIVLEAKSASLSAPNQVTVILSPTATVSVDTDLPVFWTQISGQPLIFDDPNSATTLVTAQAGNITNTLGDIIVRACLLDNPLICVDIDINARPIEEYTTTLSSRRSLLTETPSNLAITLPIQWDYTSDISTSTFYDNEGGEFDPFLARWDFPATTTYLDRFEIETWNGTAWVSIATIDKDDSLTYAFDAETVYRIVSVHVFPGSSSEIRAASDIIFIDPTTATGDIIGCADLFRPIASSVSFIVETDIPFAFLTESVEDTKYIHLQSNITLISEADTPFEQQKFELQEDEMYAHHSSNIVLITEVDFDLEGGVIG